MRLIDADKLNERCNQIIEDDWNSRTYPDSWTRAYEVFKDDINDIPTIDPKDLRPKAKWIKTGKISVRCSACNYLPAENDYNYCPNCGAKMED